MNGPNPLYAQVRDWLRIAAHGDEALYWKLRRRLYKALIEEEREVLFESYLDRYAELFLNVATQYKGAAAAFPGLVVKPADQASGARNEKRRKSLRQRRFQVVEMRRLELLTPYMRTGLVPSDSIAEIWRKCGRIRRNR